MRRTALKRRTPLLPGKASERKQRRRLGREAEAEKTHKSIVMRMERCLAAYRGWGPCSGPLQGAHLGRGRGTGLPHGTGQDIGPLCMGHHDQFDGRANGPLRQVPHEQRMILGEWWIREAREFVAHVLAAEGAPF